MPKASALNEQTKTALRRAVGLSSSNVLFFGAKGDGVADDASAIQAAIESADEVFIPAGNYLVRSRVTVRSGVSVTLSHGAVILARGGSVVFSMKPRARFCGGSVNAKGYAGVLFDFDGSASAPNFKGIEPTVVRTEIVGDRGGGTGTAFMLRADTGSAGNVYGVEIDATIDGMEVGAHLKKLGSVDNHWVNGNRIRLRAIATVNLLKMTNDSDGVGLDANVFDIEYQTITPHSGVVVDIKGRYNSLNGMVWDFNSGTALSCSAGSNRNSVSIGGLLDETISDSGVANTLSVYTKTTPGIKIWRLLKNSSESLHVEGMDLVMSNNKAFQWIDSGGVVRNLIKFTTADNVTLQTPPGAGSLFLSGFDRVELQVGGQGRAIVSEPSTSGDTPISLWDGLSLKRVSVGPPDSAGAGYRYLRVANP